MSIVRALELQRSCLCDCHRTLPESERARGVAALYDLDDALRGWDYKPIYERHGDALWREAQQEGDPSYRGVAVRFGECVYRRLLGSMLHETLHVCLGDVTKANYGIPFGLPYGVPQDTAAADEEALLDLHNFGEARAFVGVWVLGRALFGIDWDLRTARDVGTYGFTGGNALVAVPRGYRPVAHIDRTHHTTRYYARAHKIEEQARAWFTDANVESLRTRIDESRRRGQQTRGERYRDPAAVARQLPTKPGRNEPCVCGRPRKYKQCCAVAPTAAFEPSLAR